MFFFWFQYHLCSANTRALLLTTYVKFVNLFPEIKHLIQDVFKADNNLRSADAELQQRASEYLQLSIVASTDVLVNTKEFLVLVGCLTMSCLYYCIHIINVF